jgi:hypothetical protein
MSETAYLSGSVSPIPAVTVRQRKRGTKRLERWALGERLLREFCQASMVGLVDIRSGPRSNRSRNLMLLRRKFCILAKANGVGATYTAKLLGLTYSTVLYHRSPKMRETKKQWRAVNGRDRRRTTK